MSPIRPIRTDDENAAALLEIERLWGAVPDTPDGDRFEILTALVSDYEQRRYPIEEPSLHDRVRFFLFDMRGLSEEEVGAMTAEQLLVLLEGSQEPGATI